MALIDVAVEGVTAEELRKFITPKLKAMGKRKISFEIVQRRKRGPAQTAEVLVVNVPNILSVFIVFLEVLADYVLRKRKEKKAGGKLELLMELDDGTIITMPLSKEVLRTGMKIENDADVAKIKKLVIQKQSSP